MCGIFGYITNHEEALGPILIAAAERLTYRGYDSVGAATLNSGKIDLRKDVGKVDSVAAKYNIAEMRGQRGITQLRWATFGEPSQINSQPHLDSTGDMVGAHNGNVVNNVELRLEFMAEGMTVRSQNDGETCVHAVERYIKRGYEFIDAIRLAYGDLEGDYAFVIGRADDDKLYAFKKGSGMVIGIGDGFTCLSSDLPSILPLTREVIRPQDGEIVTLWADHVEVRSVKDGRCAKVDRMPETVTESMDAVQKGGYPHFMLKEIHEQSQVARELSHVLNGNREGESLVEKMKNARHLYFIGYGTSYHAASVGRFILRNWLGNHPVKSYQREVRRKNMSSNKDSDKLQDRTIIKFVAVGTFMFLFFFILYFSLSLFFSKNRAFTTSSILFETDTLRVIGDMTNISANHYRTEVHPLYVLLVNPLGSSLSRLFKSQLIAAIFLNSFLGALGTFLAFIYFYLLTQNLIDSCLLSGLFGITASQFFLSTIPETATLAVCSLLFRVT